MLIRQTEDRGSRVPTSGFGILKARHRQRLTAVVVELKPDWSVQSHQAVRISPNMAGAAPGSVPLIVGNAT
jgi:hypothetical protein